MKRCPFCGHLMADEEYSAMVSARAGIMGRVKTEKKSASSKQNMRKALAARTPEMIAASLEKARAAKAAKKAAKAAEEGSKKE